MAWHKVESAEDRAEWSRIFALCLDADEPPAWHERYIYRGRLRTRATPDARPKLGKAQPVAILSMSRADGGAAVYRSAVAVIPEARGRGLQRSAIRWSERWARSIGARDCITYTHSQNIASMSNLIRSGYLPYEPTYAWVGRNPQWVYWIKRVSRTPADC